MGEDKHDGRGWEMAGTVIEETIDPDLPICDSHHHLWDGPGERGRYLLNEFLEDVRGGHKIVKTVFAECGAMYRKEGPPEMQPVGETEFAQDMAEKSASGQLGITAVAAGIIGFADLTLGAGVAPVLEAHLAAGKNRFRGIRQSCTWDRDRTILTMGKGKGMMTETQFREGFACLQRYGLSFDAWQYFTQLIELADLARAFPDTLIIVNHTGGILGIGPYAGKRDPSFEEWKRVVTELASCPNVMMKLGGLGMPRCGFGWHERANPPTSTELAAAMASYYLFCIDVFGAERCMFESNFPVDKVSYSYTVLWNAFKRICEGFSPKERSALFHDTAVKAYRLEESGHA
jgi:L-fuconolactonase